MTINIPQFTDEERIAALIEQLDAYIAQYHGGAVELVGVEGKKVKVRLGGACLNCPLSPATLQGWVAGTIKQFFPDYDVEEAA
ncbi:MAG TPA: NifU family protein [Anaerolineaceae bacterium]|nr:NifU family protein [Anaerolineaceae bacterium]HPN53178.1 NifU family protein [Anaerolineaceae bacterium]